jgi:hypothetical protein
MAVSESRQRLQQLIGFAIIKVNYPVNVRRYPGELSLLAHRAGLLNHESRSNVSMEAPSVLPQLGGGQLPPV